MKTIYELKLHETIVIKVERIYGKGYPYEWQVTRVAGGWIYQNSSHTITQPESFFIPFNNEFMQP